MRYLLRIEGVLYSVVTWIGRIGAWISVPLMIVIIFDVITRRFLVLGSTKLQEGEWHLHAALFLLCLGFAYLKNAHVRISLVHERFSPATQRWIEFIGCLVFAIPYCAIVFYFALDFVERSWNLNEASDLRDRPALPLGNQGLPAGRDCSCLAWPQLRCCYASSSSCSARPSTAVP